MSDITCKVCGEPWDAYGARYGDMTPAEYAQLIRGKGCPSCDGAAPEDIDSEAVMIRHMDSLMEALE